MNNLEILDTLHSLPVRTYGVYPSDQIPKVWMKPAALVVNTEDHTKPGSHWIAMFVDKNGKGYYFDSFGRGPHIPEHIARLRKNCKHFRWNTKKLQSEDSDVCGQFCIMFIHYLANGFGMHEFNQLFTSDLKKNDKIAREFYDNLAKKKTLSKNSSCQKYYIFGNSKISIMNCVQGCCKKKYL